jgi:hypothetical protein
MFGTCTNKAIDTAILHEWGVAYVMHAKHGLINVKLGV